MSPQQTPSRWYRTDNAGRVFAWSARTQLNTLFRLAATLRRTVQVETLQAALEAVLPRFPIFAVHVRRGVFWSYLEANDAKPHVVADSRFPCQPWPVHRGRAFPFRVRAYHRRIAVEFSHILTDGSGAAHFLRSLLAEYLQRREGLVPNDTQDLLLPGQASHAEEVEDAFRRYRPAGLSKPEGREPAWRLPHIADPKQTCRITTGLMDLDAIKAVAKAHQATVGAFMLAHYLSVLLDVWQRSSTRRTRRALLPICVDVPVNLRRFFPSQTLRNFFVTVQVRIHPQETDPTFEALLTQVQDQMADNLKPEQLGSLIARNVGAEKHHLVRSLPGVVKGRVLPEIYRRVSLRTTTSSLSNLGCITLPSPLQSAIEHLELIPIHPNQRKITCGCVGIGDTLSVTFARTLFDPFVEQAFFGKLNDLGCPVRLETNNE